MLKKLYEKSEITVAILWIFIYVVGNSLLGQVSNEIGVAMAATMPFNLLLIGLLLLMIKRENRMEYYGLCKGKGKPRQLWYGIPLVLVATVNVWFGFRLNKEAGEALIYVVGMLAAGALEELLFRGLLYRAMCKRSVPFAILLTSVLFGAGHIVNLVNGSGMQFVANLCQMCYAMAIGFLLVAVLYTGKSIFPCMATHSLLNALSVFANEKMFVRVQLPVCAALCVISLVSAVGILRNGISAEKEKESAEKESVEKESARA